MVTKLKVIALISGGKDSFFSILHCLENGHEIVALANLHPPEEDSFVSEDMESFMYQTIGHNIIPLYAVALGLPLYRQPIIGGPVNTSKSYSVPAGNASSLSSHPENQQDETEALIPLLCRIIAAHPSANAISTGAILSDYQRTRVESVAIRLNLTPLSYLWQYPFLPPYTQTSLLEDIAAVGQESRIIKVASGGLTEEHLWLNVGETGSISRLVKSMGRFGGLEGGAVVGEGGEFETITLEGPAPLWKGRIEVTDGNREVVVGSGGTWALRFSEAQALEKSEDSTESGKVDTELRIPDSSDTEFSSLLELLRSTNFMDLEDRIISDRSHRAYGLLDSGIGSNATLFLCNLTGIEGHDQTPSIATQMARICAELVASLDAQNLTPGNISSTTILLRSMADFAPMNKCYGAIFSKPNPPARITISCGDALPDKVQVMISVTVDQCDLSERRGLHVQSRSYWAPANIGPYSQAVGIPLQAGNDERTNSQIVYVAGQIPLKPATMEVVSQCFREQTVLALQHLWRIGRTMNVNWWTSAIAFVTADSAEQAQERARVAVAAWELMHRKPSAPSDDEDENDDDAGFSARSLHEAWASNGNQTNNILTNRWMLPNWGKIDWTVDSSRAWSESFAPHCFVVQVDELPRGTQVEWASLGISGTPRISMSGGAVVTTCEINEVGYRLQCINVVTMEELNGIYDKILHEQWQKGSLIEIFTTHSVPANVLQLAQIMWIPCRRIWASKGQALHAAIRMRGYCKSRMI